MSSKFGVERILTGAIAVLAFGCQAADDGADFDPLAQDIPCASIDGGIVTPTLDGAVEVDGGATDGGAIDDDGPEEPPKQGPTILGPTPVMAYVAEVSANGTGCPRGTWSAELEKDGETFAVTFSRYVVEVEDGIRTNFKDCNLTLKLRAPEDISYTISDFSVLGYAFFEPEVRGFATFNYYFQGTPIPSLDKEKRTDLSGPLDRSFLFQDTIQPSQAIWSPCGLQRNLNIVTRIGLQKSQSRGAGYLNLSNVGHRFDTGLRFRIATKRCDKAKPR